MDPLKPKNIPLPNYLIVNSETKEIEGQLSYDRWQEVKRFLRYPFTIEPNDEFKIEEKED